jgi:hypothetical protein
MAVVIRRDERVAAHNHHGDEANPEEVEVRAGHSGSPF